MLCRLRKMYFCVHLGQETGFPYGFQRLPESPRQIPKQYLRPGLRPPLPLSFCHESYHSLVAVSVNHRQRRSTRGNVTQRRFKTCCIYIWATPYPAQTCTQHFSSWRCVHLPDAILQGKRRQLLTLLNEEVTADYGTLTLKFWLMDRNNQC